MNNELSDGTKVHAKDYSNTNYSQQRREQDASYKPVDNFKGITEQTRNDLMDALKIAVSQYWDLLLIHGLQMLTPEMKKELQEKTKRLDEIYNKLNQ